MGFFNSKSWDDAFSALDSAFNDVSKELKKQSEKANRTLDNAVRSLDSAVDDVSKEIRKQSRRANRYWDDNKGEVYSTINQTGRLLDKSLDQGFDIAGKAYHKVKNFVIEVVNQIVDIFFIQEKVKERNPDAMKMLIMEKKKNAVNVGIFNEYGDMDQSITIHSDYGISNDVYTGQVVNF